MAEGEPREGPPPGGDPVAEDEAGSGATGSPATAAGAGAAPGALPPDLSQPGALPGPGAALPVAPSLRTALDAAVIVPPLERPPNRRVAWLCAGAMVVAVGAALLAHALTALIGLVTNVAFYGHVSTSFVAPGTARLGAGVILVPVVGGLIVGLMARFGSAAIRGHGIPEVMERVLLARSRISPVVMFLKPLSAAIAIGTGGPFGAEGPIIATGGALGSLLGQTLHVTADERKTLLAAGAAAGMAATFNAPVSSVLLAVELLLFEYRARSLVPVALAAAVASAVRIAMVGNAPAFTLPAIPAASLAALASYIALGALVGVVAVGVTRAVYAVEEAFERIPVHWMWWPAMGALVVGVIGYVEPRTLGVGYYNIDAILDGSLVGRALLMLVALKFVSWVVYLGSGTSGGTLAPLFTFGSGIGSAMGGLAAGRLPSLGMDPHVAALVGMAALFAGTSHALLTSVVFAFETTRQPNGLLPLLAGCATAYLIATLLSRHSIMTVRLAQRGTVVASEYDVDYLSRLRVGEAATRDVVTLQARQPLAEVHAWMGRTASPGQHQGFPVLDDSGLLVGVVTRRNLLDASAAGGTVVADAIRRGAAVVFADQTLREAADHMVRERVGRLPVVTRAEPRRVIGILSRSDLLYAHARRLDEALRPEEPWHMADLAEAAASAGITHRPGVRRRAARMRRARKRRTSEVTEPSVTEPSAAESCTTRESGGGGEGGTDAEGGSGVGRGA